MKKKLRSWMWVEYERNKIINHAEAEQREKGLPHKKSDLSMRTISKAFKWFVNM